LILSIKDIFLNACVEFSIFEQQERTTEMQYAIDYEAMAQCIYIAGKLPLNIWTDRQQVEPG
jgi:hypothetical protein